MQQATSTVPGFQQTDHRFAGERPVVFNRRNMQKITTSEFLKLPEFPEFKPLEMSDRLLLQSYFLELQAEISDRCFTNLFLWQDFYDIRIGRYGDNICIFCASGSTPEKQFFFPPLGERGVCECVDACFDYMRSRKYTPVIRRASENFVVRHISANDACEVRGDPDISDYIYRTEDMIHLRGRRYHGQRNYIKRFKKKYPRYETEFLDRKNIAECIRFNDQWLQKKLKLVEQKYEKRSVSTADEVVFLKAEVETARKILHHFERLDLRGLAIRIGGAIRAFTVGEKLNRRMALIHIEKCDHGYLGLNQMLTNSFCQLAWADCEYVNRMEDLGIEGLRRAKQALGPHHMARKFDIFPKHHLDR
jgi:hypothetical protein